MDIVRPTVHIAGKDHDVDASFETNGRFEDPSLFDNAVAAQTLATVGRDAPRSMTARTELRNRTTLADGESHN